MPHDTGTSCYRWCLPAFTLHTRIAGGSKYDSKIIVPACFKDKAKMVAREILIVRTYVGRNTAFRWRPGSAFVIDS